MSLPAHSLAIQLALFAVGAVAAAINAVAGGGTLLAFPLLLTLGYPPLAANATCAATLWLGSLASALGYIEQLRGTRRPLGLLLIPSGLGAFLGAWLLTRTSPRLFALVVPLLVLLATGLLAAQPYLRPQQSRRRLGALVVVLLQFLICVYGGYFGAGMGILMLGVMGLYIDGDLHQLNAIKSWLAVLVNVVAGAEFLRGGLVDFPRTVALAAGALVGGYLMARSAQRLAAKTLRPIIVCFGLSITAWFAWRALRPS